MNPRRLFLRDLQSVIVSLQSQGHLLLLMLDANATETSDPSFADFIASCSLSDLHAGDPAPSTYIRSEDRRIDFIFGCAEVSTLLNRSGALSYTEGPQSDHRALYVDLNLEFLTVTPDTISPSETRALHTENPELVEAYNLRLLQYYAEHCMVARITHLYETQLHMSRDEIRIALTKWDNDQGRAMELGERTISKPSKRYKWSPTLRNLAKLRLYWKLHLREKQYSHENYSVTFDRWQRQIQAKDPSFHLPLRSTALPISVIRREFNKASKRFRTSQATPLRQQCYDDLLHTYLEDRDPSTMQESKRKARIVQNTIDGEVTRKQFRNIRNIVRPTSTSSLSRLLIPRKPGTDQPAESQDIYQLLQDTDPSDLTWDTVVEREEIERHLIAYNRASFRAASASPLGKGVIHDALTYSSLSPASVDLLSGETPADWHQDDQSLREFLASFTIPPTVQAAGTIPTEITADDVIYGFRKWRESTSTSPSGRHLGHYRSLIQHPVLLDCFVKFLNIAISNGIAVPRWSNATNVMIEKDRGQPRIHRLRIIHLFEADMNFFLKLQWGHRLVRRALQCDLLHSGQHGSIPQRMALDPIMLTQLTTDLCRILKHDFLRFDNDASACYDRIIVALAMLAARKCGMPEQAVRTHANALFFMRYTVKTMYGVSTENYHGTVFEPLFGTGQRSGASPAAWLTLLVV